MTGIRGFKGGGKSGGGSTKAPVESPDSLRSRQFARLLDLICEGEIEGLVTGDLQSVYLDKTPILNADGSYNFSGVTVSTREGTQGQAYIEGFPDVESEHSVGVQMFYDQPVVRTITSDTYDAARITVSVPQLSKVNTQNGDTTGSQVSFEIYLQPSGGSYALVKSDTIKGKTTTKYQRSYTIPLTGDAPWNIKLVRTTADSTAQTLQNDTYWESFTEITNAKLRYPNSALVGLIIDSQQFNQIPVRGYHMRLLRIQVPSNYDPETREYDGEWDGLFVTAWSNNPAWVFYDMLTTERYGLGSFIQSSQVDKWALYQIAQYCDELVPDGFGGYEPRFTCNLYIQEQREAFTVIRDLASIFRGMVYWSSGLIAAVQDAPADAAALFTNANVENGDFTYSGSSAKTRHTVALVSWNDPDDFYALKPEYVEDRAGIERYGVIQTNIVAIGCTSRGQANRCGKWLLYSEVNETETVTFRTGIEGTLVRPGQIFNVQDARRAGVRRGGRVASATTSSVTVDQAFTPSVGVTYSLSVMLPDGTVGTAEIDTIVGNVFTLAEPLAQAPQANAIWMVSSDDLSLQTFRCVSAIDAGDGVIEIAGLKHNSEKFDFIENDLILTSNALSLLTRTPDSPQNVSISESLYLSGAAVQSVVTIAWDGVERADSYTVSYRVDDGNPVVVQGVKEQLYEIRNAITGVYSVTVVAVTLNGKRSVASAAQREIFGKSAPPSDVYNFSLVGVSNGVAQLVWDQAIDLDVIIGGYVRIRHTPDTAAPAWESAIDIGPALPGGATTASVPHIDGTYLAKFVDSSGNSSVSAREVETLTASLVNMNVIDTIDESLFPGAHDGTYYPGPLGGLSLDYGGLFDDIEDFDALVSLDTSGGVAASGTYDFDDTFDLGAVYTSRVFAAITVVGFDELNTIDQRLDDIDSWVSFDGDNVDDVNATLYVATTDDDPAGSPTWSSWRPFFVGQYTCRAYKFQLRLTSEDAAHNISVDALTVTIDMPDRTEAERNLTTGTGAYTVTFPAAFKATPSIGITANNMATGDYYTITSQSAAGFDIQFRNSAAAGIARNFDYLAKGYGYSA